MTYLVNRLRARAYQSNAGLLRGPAMQAADRIEELDAQVQRLREAGDNLSGYAGHDDNCQIVTHGVWSDPTPCTCGYEAAWKAWHAALKEIVNETRQQSTET